MKYKMVHTDFEGKLMTTLFFKTRRQARAARRAILKNKWFKCYGPTGKKQFWKLMRTDADIHVAIMKATVKEVEYE